MKKLITIVITIYVTAACFQADATNYTHSQTSPALLSAAIPEPSTFTLLLASAFAFCLLKDRFKIH